MRKLKMISGCITHGSVKFDSDKPLDSNYCSDKNCEGCMRFHSALDNYVKNLMTGSAASHRLANPLPPNKSVSEIYGTGSYSKTELLTAEEITERYGDLFSPESLETLKNKKDDTKK